MIKNNLRWIVGLMSIALLGLIIFQLFWIDQLVKGNEERFEKDAIEALSTVATKLEKQEITKAFSNIQALRQKHINDNLRCYQENIRQKARKRARSTPANYGGQQTLEIYDTIVLGNNMEVYVNFSQSYYNRFNPYEQVAKIGEAIEEKEIEIKGLEDQLTRTQIKYQQTLEVVENLMTPRKPIFERINPSQLDSLLKNELLAKGIDIHYEYAITQKDYPNYLLANIPKKNEKLSDSRLKAALFPNDVFQAGMNELRVFFPKKTDFLLGKIWSALLSSGVLILVILICFGYSIRVILKQKKLSEIKNDFINNMTHELKTPIATVSLAVEALNDKEIAGSLLRDKYLKVIGDENKRLSNQVEKVLQIATVDKKDYQLKKEILDVHSLIDESLRGMQMQVEQRNGRITVVKQAEDSWINGDKSHLTNIISNLLDNANKYSPNSPNIIIRTLSDEENFVLSVQDHGIGMNKDQQKHIFEKFYRVPTGNIHDVKGFGLGLSYVNNVVQAHEGKISVESELGKGSKFEVKLPLNKNRWSE